MLTLQLCTESNRNRTRDRNERQLQRLVMLRNCNDTLTFTTSKLLILHCSYHQSRILVDKPLVNTFRYSISAAENLHLLFCLNLSYEDRRHDIFMQPLGIACKSNSSFTQKIPYNYFLNYIKKFEHKKTFITM